MPPSTDSALYTRPKSTMFQSSSGSSTSLRASRISSFETMRQNPTIKLDNDYYYCQVYSMKILELLCNPRPASFNRALADRARESLAAAGHEVLFHDLYAENFDPVLDSAELARGFSLDPLVQSHCRQLAEADGLLIVHPDWWGQPPALLKGWIDRVLRQGIAYDLDGAEFSEKAWTPLLAGKEA